MESRDYQFFHENEVKVTLNMVRILRWLIPILYEKNGVTVCKHVIFMAKEIWKRYLRRNLHGVRKYLNIVTE